METVPAWIIDLLAKIGIVVSVGALMIWFGISIAHHTVEDTTE